MKRKAPVAPGTLEEIARSVGVDKATVSRALNKGELVNPETKKKVLEAARRLGYVPASRKNRAPCIGLVLPTDGTSLTTSYYRGTVMSFFQRATTKGMDLKLMGADEFQRNGADLGSMLSRKGLEGLVLFSTLYRPDMEKDLRDSGVAVALFDDLPRGNGPDHPFSSVGENAESGMYEAVKYLKDLGHRHIALVAHNRRLHNQVKQWAFRKALARLDLPAGDEAVWICEEPGRLSAEIRVLDGLKARPETTALIGSIEELTLGAMDGAAVAKRRIPQDLSLLSWGDPGGEGGRLSGICHVRTPFEEMVEEALAMLERGSTGDRRQLATRLVPSKTTWAV